MFPEARALRSKVPGPSSAMGSGCRIECIFFSEFHPTLGPKITYQVTSGSQGWGREISTLSGAQPSVWMQ